jgi:hypothetical protein
VLENNQFRIKSLSKPVEPVARNPLPKKRKTGSQGKASWPTGGRAHTAIHATPISVLCRPISSGVKRGQYASDDLSIETITRR